MSHSARLIATFEGDEQCKANVAMVQQLTPKAIQNPKVYSLTLMTNILVQRDEVKRFEEFEAAPLTIELEPIKVVKGLELGGHVVNCGFLSTRLPFSAEGFARLQAEIMRMPIVWTRKGSRVSIDLARREGGLLLLVQTPGFSESEFAESMYPILDFFSRTRTGFGSVTLKKLELVVMRTWYGDEDHEDEAKGKERAGRKRRRQQD